MRRVLISALAGGLLLLAACGGGDNGDAESAAGDDAQDQPAAAGETITVTGEEYQFNGAPTSLSAGPTTFTFENVGTEPHEMVIFKLNTDKPVEELLKLPQKKAEKLVDQVGGTGAGPGKEAKQPVEADLDPGDYAMVCFVPVEGKGPPHFTRGMFASFTVE